MSGETVLSGALALGLTAAMFLPRAGPGRREVSRHRVNATGVPGREGWARRRDLGPLYGTGRGRLRLGAVPGPRWDRRRVVRTEPAQSLIVIGPTQSGKTSSLAVPAILEWEGPLLAASVKSDLLADTEAWRASLGKVWCFDPAGATGRPSSWWSPLRGARTWGGARRVANDLTEVARTASTSADAEFWYATAAKLIAPLLFAASSSGATMADVLRWVDTQEVAEVFELLERTGVREALWAVQASWQRDERQRSAVYTTAETVLEAFAEGSSERERREEIDPEELLEANNTLYVCAPSHDQRRLRGLFVALVKQVLEAGFSAATRSGPLDPPLLVVLDEAANIAPVGELDGLAATCAGHGIQLVTVWQDLAQIAARYGSRAPTVLNNHRARLFLSGIAEPSTLEQASALVGEIDVPSGSVTVEGGGRRSVTTAATRRRLMPPEALRQLRRGTGVLIYGDRPPARLVLTPWWSDPLLSIRGGSVGFEAIAALPRTLSATMTKRRGLVSSWWVNLGTGRKRKNPN